MIRQLTEKLQFPKEASEYLDECLDKILKTDSAMHYMGLAMDSFFLPGSEEYTEHLQKVSDLSGVHRYSVDMGFILLCARPLRYIYQNKGLGEELFIDTMMDAKYKLMECKAVHNIWGTFVLTWFKGFFTLDRFKLGRLQYDKCKNHFGSHGDILSENDMVLSCHIPSAGPLDIEDVKNSLRMAYKFHKDIVKDGKLKVVCGSWLLHTELIKKLKPESNIRKFHDLFHILVDVDRENIDFWRIFNKEYKEGILDEIVPENSLQKTVLEHLKSGGTTGWGLGIIIVDENY